MYRIQTHPAMDYCASHGPHGQTGLFGLLYPYCAAVLFSREGSFIETRIRMLGFDAPVSRIGGSSIIEDPFFQEKVQDLVKRWQSELGFADGPIVIDRFRVPELLLGIDDLPRHLKKFVEDPASFSADEQSNYPDIIRDWEMNGNYVLWWGKDYYLNRSGEVI